MISIVPKTARPMRHVRPTILPLRLRMARDAVERPLDAGAVVVPERADVVDDVLDVLLGDLALQQHRLAAAAEARLRRRPRSITTSMTVWRVGQRAEAAPGSPAAAPRAATSMSSVISRRLVATGPPAFDLAGSDRSVAAGRCASSWSSRDGRHERRLGDAHQRSPSTAARHWRSAGSLPPPGAGRVVTRRFARPSERPARGRMRPLDRPPLRSRWRPGRSGSGRVGSCSAWLTTRR